MAKLEHAYDLSSFPIATGKKRKKSIRNNEHVIPTKQRKCTYTTQLSIMIVGVLPTASILNSSSDEDILTAKESKAFYPHFACCMMAR